MTAREEVLGRIRKAIANSATEPKPSTVRYRTTSGLRHRELVDLFAERLRDYGAAVRPCTPDELGAKIGAALAARGASRVVVPAGLDLPLPPGVECVTDDGLGAAELDTLEGVITTATAAIAETGTIVLDGSPDCGRRAISLVPDLHVCVVRVSDIVQTVPEGLALLEPAHPLTFISGPSATSDIELDRVEGVHGPRRLVVVLAG
ncbi:MAG: LutC/YkgG family protein [Streptosporangiaceae bacterium]